MRKMMLLLMLFCVVAASATAGTVAYWRFEEGPLNANVARGGQADGAWYPGALDSSGNGYALSAWSNGGYAGEAYRSQVPIEQVPLSGAVNNFSLQSTGDVPGMWTQTGAGIQTWKPTAWTVECWFRSTSINNWRVMVGRDGDDVGGRDDPPFRLMMTNASAIRANFTDMAGAYHELNTSNGFVQSDQWYHAAATSDGTTFRLYVNGNLIGEALLDNTTDARLSDGSNGRAPDANWAPGNWTVFRGMWNGGHSDRWFGYIDEVRLSDVALTPAQFLNNGAVLQGPDDWAVFPEDVTTAEFTVTAAAVPYGETMTDVAWYEDITEPNTLIVDDGMKYVINTTADASTLTIYNVDAGDAGDYHATATFSDASIADSTRKGHLYINTGLVHRYSFNSDVSDSVGSADGTIIDPNAPSDPRISFADGQMLIGNYDLNASPADVNQIAYVELPGNGLITSLENYMTIEIWLTPHRNNNWTTIYAFGDSNNEFPWVDGFTGQKVGVLAQLNRNGTTGPSFSGIAPNSQVNLAAPDVLTLDEEIMFTAVWNGNTGRMIQYVNGVEAGSGNIPVKLSQMEDPKCWIGVGFWPDAVLNASINELRIYDTALPGYYVAAHYAAGPDVTVVELKPDVAAPADAAVYPDLRTDDVDSVDMVANITNLPAGTTVSGVQWFKDPDPAISGDEIALAADAKYNVSFADTDTTLTINNIDSADEAYYYAVVTINTGAASTGAPGKLTVSHGLVHRYSFDADATDSIGTADGAIVDPGSHISFANGQLIMDNPNINASIANAGLISYVDFPDGIVSALHDYMTIEIWLTPHRTNDWTPIFAFGRTGNDDPFTQGFNGCQTGIYAQLNQGGNNLPAYKAFNGSGNIALNSGVTIAADEAIMYAVTWDGNTGTTSLYLNGELQASTGTNMQLADISDTMNWLGIPYWPDSVLNASIDELRIYDWALDAPWISEHYLVGPDQTTVNPCLEYPQFDVAGGGVSGDKPDCQVTLSDFVEFANEWLKCGRLEGCN